MDERTIFDFTVQDIDNNMVNLEKYRGKTILIVNVASKCGFTPQYSGLQKLYETYKDKGFVILGFPANDFLWQEPGTNDEIKQFCLLKYNVTFPIFSKISLKGNKKHPLYAFLTGKKTNPDFSGDIKWNFTKFLINGDGTIVDRFEPAENPESERMSRRIEEAVFTGEHNVPAAK